MTKPRFGELPSRYTFVLNPYSDYRFTRCPNCDKPTRLRKYVLFIHVDPDHLLSMGKTCRFCPKCEWLIAHKDEVESELAILFNRLDPKAIGNDYLIIGTVERKVWREGLRHPKIINEILPHVADFKEVRRVEVRPAGWYPAEK